MYIDKEQKKRFRHEEYIQYLQRLYNSSRLIMESDWETVRKLGRRMDRLNKKSHHLKSEVNEMKKEGLVQHFLGEEIEDFIFLNGAYQKLLKVSINTSDYLKKTLGKDVEEDDVIFETDEEALEAIETCFLEIEEIKKDNLEYLTEEFE